MWHVEAQGFSVFLDRGSMWAATPRANHIRDGRMSHVGGTFMRSRVLLEWQQPWLGAPPAHWLLYMGQPDYVPRYCPILLIFTHLIPNLEAAERFLTKTVWMLSGDEACPLWSIPFFFFLNVLLSLSAVGFNWTLRIVSLTEVWGHLPRVGDPLHWLQ